MVIMIIKANQGITNHKKLVIAESYMDQKANNSGRNWKKKNLAGQKNHELLIKKDKKY